jgi:RimJ/RimL family protein N-acetyltransferase
MRIITIKPNTVSLIESFLSEQAEISDHFRYFQSRNPSTIIQQHVYTVVGIDEETNQVIAYGHIDYDEKYWLGICIWKSHCGKGYGTEIMNQLIQYADEHQINLSLSVDLTNTNAIRLYEKYRFIPARQTQTVLYMNRPYLIK